MALDTRAPKNYRKGWSPSTMPASAATVAEIDAAVRRTLAAKMREYGTWFAGQGDTERAAEYAREATRLESGGHS